MSLFNYYLYSSQKKKKKILQVICGLKADQFPKLAPCPPSEDLMLTGKKGKRESGSFLFITSMDLFPVYTGSG